MLDSLQNQAGLWITGHDDRTGPAAGALSIQRIEAKTCFAGFPIRAMAGKALRGKKASDFSSLAIGQSEHEWQGQYGRKDQHDTKRSA